MITTCTALNGELARQTAAASQLGLPVVHVQAGGADARSNARMGGVGRQLIAPADVPRTRAHPWVSPIPTGCHAALGQLACYGPFKIGWDINI